MLTLLCNASRKYSHNKQPNSYKVLLPATLDLEGTWYVAIENIQYPYNCLNFNEQFVALMISVKESNSEKKKKRASGKMRYHSCFFKAQFRLSFMKHPMDPNAKALWICQWVWKQIGREFDGTKLMKIQSGYYDSPAARIGKYFLSEYARNLPVKEDEPLREFQKNS